MRCSRGLNEGLPQKGKRFDRAKPVVEAGVLASMKGFPRRGSDATAFSGATLASQPQ